MISVQSEDFDVATEYADLTAGDESAGAVVFFVGRVREHNDGRNVTGLTLEHYPGMTERALEEIVGKARERWPVEKIRVIHRVGNLVLGDQIVFVGVSSAHRKAAFDAAEFVMDYLKAQAPFWKKEQTGAGSVWVEARAVDQQAAQRWSKS